MGSSPEMQPYSNYFQSIPGFGDALKTVFNMTGANGGNSGGGLNFPSLGGAPSAADPSSAAPSATPVSPMFPSSGAPSMTPTSNIPATDPAAMGGSVGNQPPVAPAATPAPAVGGAATPSTSGSWGGMWNAGGFGPSSQQDMISKLLLQTNPSIGGS